MNGDENGAPNRTDCAKLTNDIVLGSWTPFAPKNGYITSAFGGTFDGNNHTIKNLTVANGDGLFASVNGAKITNLKVEGTVSNNSSTGVGGIVGKTQGMVTIENCAFSGSVSSKNSKASAGVGGIVGIVNSGKLVLENCYSTANVSSKNCAGGILGRVTAAGTTIKNSFSTGTITGVANGGIVGGMINKNSSISNCYWTAESLNGIGSGSGKVLNSKQESDITFVVDKLGDAFAVVGGKVVLAWETSAEGPASKEFSVSLTPSSAMLQMNNSGRDVASTFEATYINTADTVVTGIVWSVGDAKDEDGNASGSESDFVEAQVSENDEWALIVTAKKPGTAYVTAAVSYTEKGEAKTMRKTAEVTVYPCISTVEIENVNQPGAVAVGQTVQAKVNIFGGGEYDYEKFPPLTYQWYWYDASDGMSGIISGATDRSYAIPEEYAHSYIEVEVKCGGETVKSHDDTYTPVSSADYGKLYPVAYDKDFTLPTVIKKATPLTLPTAHTKGSVKANIEWSSSNPDIITKGGAVTPPKSGKAKVTLTAKFTCGSAFANRTFTITVWSQAEVDKELSDQQRPIKEALEKAGFELDGHTFRPDFDTDKNLLTIFREKLGDASIEVSIKAGSVKRYNNPEGTADIAEDGTLTYFYIDDLDLTPVTHGTVNFNLTFVLEMDGIPPLEYPASAVFGWDKAKVRAALEKDICGQLTAQELVAEGDSAEAVTQDLTLPFNVNGKTWTQTTWTSSDAAVLSVHSGVGAEPATGVIHPSLEDKTVTLTATHTFTYDASITCTEIFRVTVKAREPEIDYQAVLDKAFAQVGMKDYVTGEALDSANVVNDIRIPDTGDLGRITMSDYNRGFDGKYTPIVVTSDNTDVIRAPDTANAARLWVYRPNLGEEPVNVSFTVKIVDRPAGPQEGQDLSLLTVLASRTVTVTVQPVTQNEIDTELALMQRVKEHYWDGIKKANSDKSGVTGNLWSFIEVYEEDGQLVWVRDDNDSRGIGIHAEALDGWYDQQQWRCFRSSNPDVISHENLLVTRQKENKAVTITSCLSSNRFGRYEAVYPDTACFKELTRQIVSASVIVQGTEPTHSGVVSEQSKVLFTLQSASSTWIARSAVYDLPEGTTVFDVFKRVLGSNGYTYGARGSYIYSVTSPDGETLGEFDLGGNSGWMYKVNGVLVNRYMGAQTVSNNDNIVVFFTKDYTQEPGVDDWKPTAPVIKTETVTNEDGSTTKTETKADGTVVETTTRTDGGTFVAETKPDGSVETIENRADGTEVKTSAPAGSTEITASVRVPKSVGSTRVDIPVSKPTGGMVAVIVHPDGTEEIIKNSIVTEAGVALRAEGDMQIKIVDRSKSFADAEKHWSRDAVEFASSRELFNGVSEDSFGPNLSMTRGMVNTVLARLAGADTTGGGKLWYAKGTEWAKENGISDGTNPEQEVTREQLATMLWRYAGSPAVDGELGFEDAGIVSIWAYDAIKWCVDNGIMNGIGNDQVAPKELAQRGQVAAMLMRFLQATV